MISLLLAATLNIGVYYTAPNAALLLHNRYDKEQIEVVEKNIKTEIKNLERLINKEVFGEAAVEFKIVFIEYWPIDNPPIYSGADVLYALDADEILEMRKKIKDKNRADVFLTIFNHPLIRCYPNCEAKEKIVRQIDGIQWLQEIILTEFNKLSSKHMMGLLAHEIGHYLNLDHPSRTACKAKMDIMCEEAQLIFGEAYKQAWRDFYYQKTGQRFQPR